MTQIYGTSWEGKQCYTLKVCNKKFLFITKPDLSKLSHFHPSHENVQCYNKNKSKMEVEEIDRSQELQLRQLKLHLDLNYLKQILKGEGAVQYIVMTHYQDFIVLPYLIRNLKANSQNLRILSTHLMYEMGRLYLSSFHQRLSNFDKVHLRPQHLSFEEESILQDLFFDIHGVQITTWVKLFGYQQIQNCLKFVTRLNYKEQFDAFGVTLSPHSSGYSMGSCMWLFETALKKQRILFIKELSNQKWRSVCPCSLQATPQEMCKKFQSNSLQDLDLIIFANADLVDDSITSCNSDTEVQKFVIQLQQNMQRGINTDVTMFDELTALDMIEHISFEMKDQFKQVFFENSEFNRMLSYVNSYLEFLAPRYQNRIYKDPPQYPFEGLMLLRDKGLSSCGDLLQVSERQKVPMKELILRSTPYVNFKPEYSAHIENLSLGGTFKNQLFLKLKTGISSQQLRQTVSRLKPKKIISYCPKVYPALVSEQAKDSSEKVAVLEFGKLFKISHGTGYDFCQARNLSQHSIFSQYEMNAGILQVFPIRQQFLKLTSDWANEVAAALKAKYVQVLTVHKDAIKTANSLIYLENHQIFVQTQATQEFKLILEIIDSITTTLRLK